MPGKNFSYRRKSRKRWPIVVLFFGFGLLGRLQGQEILPPIGPYIHLTEEHFRNVPSWNRTNRLVLTPYFYWYDIFTKAHIVDPDGSDALTTHPPTLQGFSYKLPSWHETQLRDMIDAGIDVVLPVYWGEPSARRPGKPIAQQPWSFSGLPPLVQAREKLLQEGLNPPRIGMFYDTSTLRYNRAGKHIDLTTPYGKEWFYESIRDFFSLIPPKHWALIDGRPIIFLYSASFAANYDSSCIAYVKERFAQDFGGRVPFIVREVSWKVPTDKVYAWGGALGLKNLEVASLGPGYNDSAVPGRVPTIVDRENGAFFERNWIRFLRRPKTMVFIETWNEYHEGSNIADCKEYGRQYIQLNRKYVRLFKEGIIPPFPRGRWSDVSTIWVQLGPTNIQHGIQQVESADGVTAPTEKGGRLCRMAVPTVHPARYMYFRIDDSFKWASQMDVEVKVEYFDEKEGAFTLEYDGSDPNAPFDGAYTRAGKTIHYSGSMTWKTAVFRLSKARFENRENAGADFRIAVLHGPLYVSRVEVRRLDLPREAGTTVHGMQLRFSRDSDALWTDSPDRVSFPQTNLVQLKGGLPETMLLWTQSWNASSTLQWVSRLRIRFRPEVPSHISLGGIFLTNLLSPGSVQMEFFSPSSVRLRTLPEGGIRWIPFSWRPNTWYWVRIEWKGGNASDDPSLSFRLWPADQKTAEPSWWTFHEHLPLPSTGTLRLGWLAPPIPSATLESDVLFAVVDSAPFTQIVLPAWHPPWIQFYLDREFSNPIFLRLEGPPDGLLLLQKSEDFSSWQSIGFVSLNSQGWAQLPFSFDEATHAFFYRARLYP